MSNFGVEEGRLGSLETLHLTDSGSGSSAVVARRGATLLSWDSAIVGGGNIDGYVDEDELVSQDGVRSGVMAPFSNRIRNGTYRFDGEQHDLLPGVPEGERRIYHGFLREMDCDVVSADATDTDVRVHLATRKIRPGTFAGYPFAVDLEVTYILTGAGLTLKITGRNVGDRAAPYGSGWHPYFRVGTHDIDRLELHVPAQTAIRTDDELIPLDGERAFVPVAEHGRPIFGTPAVLGDAVIDAAYTDLVPDPDGVTRTRVRDPETGLALTIWQRGGNIMHLFTGDTVAREPRTSIALEPVELMTDAFNRPDCQDALTLLPGAQRDFVCGVDASADH